MTMSNSIMLVYKLMEYIKFQTNLSKDYFLEANQNPSKTKINNFINKLDQEVDTFCRVNGFKKEFTFEGNIENGVFSVSPTHLGYKNKISFLEE